MYWNRNDFDFPIASSRQKKNSLWLFFWSGRRSLADAWVRCSTCALVWFSSSHYPHALKTRHWRLFFTGFRFPSPYKKRTALGCSFGAGEGNRTLVFSLGSWVRMALECGFSGFWATFWATYFLIAFFMVNKLHMNYSVVLHLRLSVLLTKNRPASACSFFYIVYPSVYKFQA